MRSTRQRLMENFNVHNLFRFRVISSNKKDLEIFRKKFSFFRESQIKESDIDIYLGHYKIEESKIHLTTKDSVCGENFIHFNDQYKLLRWSILLKNLENKKWEIFCYCNHNIGYEALITKVIRPIFSLKLAQENKNLVHCSSISYKDKAYIFSAFPGVGKSSVSFFLLKDNRTFLSDENTLIDQYGNVYSFPLSIPITTYNLRYLNFKINLRSKERLELKIGDLIHFLSKGFLEKSFSLNPEKYFKIKEKATLEKIFIMTKSPTDFFVKKISLMEGVRKLFLINDYEMMFINKYLNNYFLVNDSKLSNKNLQISNNFKKILNNKEIFHININQRNLKKSYSELEKLLDKQGY